MLFLTYWQVNEDIPLQERAEVAQRLTSEGVFPPEDIDIIRWDVTPDEWGILLIEADDVADVQRALHVWRTEAGFFEFTKTAPAQPLAKAMTTTVDVLQSVAQASRDGSG